MTEAVEALQQRMIIWVRDDHPLKKRLWDELSRGMPQEEREEKWEEVEKQPLMQLEDLGVVGGCEVKGLWLAHHIDVFARYKDDFAKLVNESDGLYSESYIKADISYEEKEKFLKMFKQLALKYKLLDEKRKLTPQDEKRLLAALKFDNPAARFFHAVEALAREKGIAVASADPIHNSENYAVHLFMNEMIQAWRERGVIGGGMLVSASMAALGFGFLRHSVDRRTLLKTGAGAGIGAFISAVSGLSWGANVRNKHGNAERAGEGPLSIFLYNFEDYRDAVGSAGLEQYCRALSQAAKRRGDTRKPKVFLVYGRAHQSPINYYNDHPKRRNATIRGYFPTFGSIRLPTLFMQRPIRSGGGIFYSHENTRLEY